jgi:hypothetical protein
MCVLRGSHLVPTAGKTSTDRTTRKNTALIFAYIERIFNEQDLELAVATSISKLENLLPTLRQVGFDDTVIDESWEVP